MSVLNHSQNFHLVKRKFNIINTENWRLHKESPLVQCSADHCSHPVTGFYSQLTVVTRFPSTLKQS